MNGKLMGSLVLIGFVALGSPVSAACHVHRAGVVQHHVAEAKLVVPFAVPVGVPVAVVSPFVYGYSGFAVERVAHDSRVHGTVRSYDAGAGGDGNSSAQADSTDGRLVASSQAFPRGARQQEAGLLVTEHCAACHRGSVPQGQFSLERAEGLSLRDRLRAIRAVLSRRMPKGAALTDEQLRGVVDELAGYE